MAKQIILTFNEDGTVESKVEGVKGQSCQDASAFIEKALGKVTSNTKTREYYEKEDNKSVLRRG